MISIGTILGPVGAAVIIYRDDLTQLVITPQIRDIINGNSNLIPMSTNPIMEIQTTTATQNWVD